MRPIIRNIRAEPSLVPDVRYLAQPIEIPSLVHQRIAVPKQIRPLGHSHRIRGQCVDVQAVCNRSICMVVVYVQHMRQVRPLLMVDV